MPHLQHLVRSLFDRTGDSMAMRAPGCQRLQNQKIQGALHQVELVVCRSSRHSTRTIHRLQVGRQLEREHSGCPLAVGGYKSTKSLSAQRSDQFDCQLMPWERHSSRAARRGDFCKADMKGDTSLCRPTTEAHESSENGGANSGALNGAILYLTDS
jgi:hypothetical protein